MKKQMQLKRDDRVEIIPEYGKQKLLSCAESFRDLAELFESGQEDEAAAEPADRQEYLCKRRMQENQGLIAEHLKEMSHILAAVAKETCRCHPLGERRFRQMSLLLRESGILLQNYLELEHEDGRREISLTMRQAGKRRTRFAETEHISAEDVADYLSVAMNRRLCMAKNTPPYLTENDNTYYFLEEPPYHLLTGFARAVKESEKVSGDSYSFCEADTGRLLILLSDGVGSGEAARRESERVIEMMERFLEAGFGKETAVQMVNGALVTAGQDQAMSTLDICDIDLYTGNCEFMKVGAACTYIKRGRLVDRLSAQSVPLGVFGEMNPEIQTRTLLGGDYVILLSDGVLEALAEGMGEQVLPEIIGRMEYQNPGEIANQILAYAIGQGRGRIRDDMTVLVAGIWNQEDIS
ncbi:MAG: SpoIIE family protein phosphatase [Bacteroidales bacterium]|nr:SpoIIE family protein phosphatase [Bacteroidales bacterium]MCM1416163.1 SpoIIE family protein phosphatase [bacterium]MCM1422732.1 SpoIIE family protein phosphatase [bacterium]